MKFYFQDIDKNWGIFSVVLFGVSIGLLGTGFKVSKFEYIVLGGISFIGFLFFLWIIILHYKWKGKSCRTCGFFIKLTYFELEKIRGDRMVLGEYLCLRTNRLIVPNMLDKCWTSFNIVQTMNLYKEYIEIKEQERIVDKNW